MSAGRVFASLASCVAVAGCAVVAVGMGSAHGAQHRVAAKLTSAAPTARPAFVAATPDAAQRTLVATGTAGVAAPTSSAAGTSAASAVAGAASTTRAAAASAAARAAARAAANRAAAATSPATRAHAAPKPVTHTKPKPVTKPKPKPVSKPAGQALPLNYSTGNATRVITVTARSHGSTVATLQPWTKQPGGGWRKQGTAITAHIGADGMGSASESVSRTPTGSFTLTQAFGHYRDPGTPLPYFHTNSADWWISQPGRLYNTHQHCSSGCSFTRGNPNEHLYYETPYYNYAVVIDYNTRNAPGGVHAGRGSAFFLHVTDGAPTAGCVAIPQNRLLPIMRWLYPSTHPRILIGVT